MDVARSGGYYDASVSCRETRQVASLIHQCSSCNVPQTAAVGFYPTLALIEHDLGAFCALRKAVVAVLTTLADFPVRGVMAPGTFYPTQGFMTKVRCLTISA